MKRRLTYAGLLVVCCAWMWVITYAFNWLDAKSDLQLLLGMAVVLGSIVVFPTLIRKWFGKQIKADIEKVFGDSLLGNDSKEKK